MILEQDSYGNLQVYQSESKRHHWGFIDKNNNYITSRSEKKGQIFHLYRNAIAIQLELLEYLEKIKCDLIKVYVPDFEKEGFFAIVKANEFRQLAIEEFGDKAIFNYDLKNFARYGKQIRCSLNRFTRQYSKIKPLTMYIK